MSTQTLTLTHSTRVKDSLKDTSPKKGTKTKPTNSLPHTHTHTHTHTHSHTHTHKHTYTHIHTHNMHSEHTKHILTQILCIDTHTHTHHRQCVYLSICYAPLHPYWLCSGSATVFGW